MTRRRPLEVKVDELCGCGEFAFASKAKKDPFNPLHQLYVYM